MKKTISDIFRIVIMGTVIMIFLALLGMSIHDSFDKDSIRPDSTRIERSDDIWIFLMF